jgi:hypothetical protein
MGNMDIDTHPKLSPNPPYISLITFYSLKLKRVFVFIFKLSIKGNCFFYFFVLKKSYRRNKILPHFFLIKSTKI